MEAVQHGEGGSCLALCLCGAGGSQILSACQGIAPYLARLGSNIAPTFIHKGACIAFAQNNCGALLIWQLQSQHESCRGPVSSLHLDGPQAAFQYTETLAMPALESISVVCCA